MSPPPPGAPGPPRRDMPRSLRAVMVAVGMWTSAVRVLSTGTLSCSWLAAGCHTFCWQPTADAASVVPVPSGLRMETPRTGPSGASIPVTSVCEHHLMPFAGIAHVTETGSTNADLLARGTPALYLRDDAYASDAEVYQAVAADPSLVIVPEKASAIWEGLSREAVPVGVSCWDWLEIKAGIPVITPATQEQFVPQMANLEAIGGVSFQKGCYPGQEIVARSQYLGKIKRRMYLANIRPGVSGNPVEAGDELFGADMGEQSVGMVVNASPSPDGGFDVLAVIQTSSVEAATVHWKSLAGPSLQIMPLPYSLG